MRPAAQLGAFDLLVVAVGGALGLFVGWFIGSYAALALGGLISLLVGSDNWLWSLATLGGLVGAAGGAALGVARSARALRSARLRNAA